MHRSGTSLFSNIFTHLGFTHGDKLLPPNQFNPLGYWEDSDLMSFNNKLLEAAGMAWDSVRLINFQEENKKLWSSFEEGAKKLILQKMGNSSGLVFKDPRLCLLLSFWYKILDELAIPYFTILLFRNPEEVRLSLQRRNEFHFGKTDYLYWMYYANAIEQLQNGQAFLLNLEDIIQKNEFVIRELTTFLNINFTEFRELISSSKTIKPDLLSIKSKITEFYIKNENLPLIEEVFQMLNRCKGTLTSSKIPFEDIQKWKKLATQFQSILGYAQYSDYKVNELDAVLKSQKPVAQLFYGNSNDNLTETQSQTTSIEHHPLTFTIPRNNTFHKLRFDPLNDYVYMRLENIRFFENGNERKLEYTLSSNAIVIEKNTYLFDSEDSQIYIDFEGNTLDGVDQVQLWVEYMAVGAEALNMAVNFYKSRSDLLANKLEKSLLEEEQRIVQMDQLNQQNDALAIANELLTRETENLKNRTQELSFEVDFYKNWWKINLKKINHIITLPFRILMKSILTK
jgi:hypothetical protein